MIYKLILGKSEIQIDEEERDFFVNNKDKKFIALKNGNLVNPSFVQGIVRDHQAGQSEGKLEPPKEVKMIDGKPHLVSEGIKKLSDKLKV